MVQLGTSGICYMDSKPSLVLAKTANFGYGHFRLNLIIIMRKLNCLNLLYCQVVFPTGLSVNIKLCVLRGPCLGFI